jgi:hypothetical protein
VESTFRGIARPIEGYFAMLPPLHFWFTGAAFFTIGSFALFAILGFAGIANMTERYRRLVIAGYAVACALFLIGWYQTAQQEQASALRDAEFSQMQDSFSALQTAINKIANSADVSLNQSADQIAGAVIARIQPLQKQVETLSKRPDDELYQDGLPLARVAGVAVNDSKTAASFQAVTAGHQIDFSKELELQGARLSCASAQGPSSVMTFGASQSYTYLDVICKVLGPRQ